MSLGLKGLNNRNHICVWQVVAQCFEEATHRVSCSLQILSICVTSAQELMMMI